jgi:hypothetical protein
VSHSRRSPRAAEKARERLMAFRARKRQEGAAPTAQVDEPTPCSPSPEFQRAYSGHPITPEAAVWSEDSRYMRWTLETCQMGSRLSHSRNHPNPANTNI